MPFAVHHSRAYRCGITLPGIGDFPVDLLVGSHIDFRARRQGAGLLGESAQEQQAIANKRPSLYFTIDMTSTLGCFHLLADECGR